MSTPAKPAEAAKPLAPKPAGSDKPQPMAWALFRNEHEAERATMKVLQKLLDEGNMSAFSVAWSDYVRCLNVHAELEDETFFPLANKLADNVADKEGFAGEHDALLHLDKELARATDLARCKELFAERMRIHAAHLQHEERDLMPLTQKMGATPTERAMIYRKEVLGYVFTSKERTAGFDYMVAYMVRVLAEHGSTSESPAVATRVVVHGLWAAVPAERWNGPHGYRALCQRACPAAVWAAIVAAVPELDLDKPAEAPL